MKLRTKIILFATILTLVAMGWFASLFADQFAAVQSIESPQERLYTFTYQGDYGFDDFLAQGGASSAEEMAQFITDFLTHGFAGAASPQGEFGCSVLTATSSDGDYLTARNFDWNDHDGDMVIMRTVPHNGYVSVAASYVDFLGFGDDYTPQSTVERMMLLATIYVPLDGINEAGLSVADLIVRDGEIVNQMTDRVDLTTTSAIRLLLDRAANVGQAIELLSECDMHSDIGRAHHLAISDSEGRSVVVEWIGGEMVVIESPICTNHYLVPIGNNDSAISTESQRRFAMLEQSQSLNPQMSEGQITAAIAEVADKDTRWTAIFDHKNKRAIYHQNGEFDKPYVIDVME